MFVFADIGVIIHPRCWSFEFMIVPQKYKLAGSNILYICHVTIDYMRYLL